MALPPRHRTLSECSTGVRVQGQLTASTVTVFADGVQVAQDTASWADQTLMLPGGASLAAGAKVTATQALGVDTSVPSSENVEVQQQRRRLDHRPHPSTRPCPRREDRPAIADRLAAASTPARSWTQRPAVSQLLQRAAHPSRVRPRRRACAHGHRWLGLTDHRGAGHAKSCDLRHRHAARRHCCSP
jgi:hypothetical protein